MVSLVEWLLTCAPAPERTWAWWFTDQCAWGLSFRELGTSCSIVELMDRPVVGLLL